MPSHSKGTRLVARREIPPIELPAGGDIQQEIAAGSTSLGSAKQDMVSLVFFLNPLSKK